MIEDPYVTIARHLGPMGDFDRDRERRPLGCFVALGDSFTAGNGCDPGEGWADLVAARLRRRNPGLLYRNLAVDGATSEQVSQQVAAGLRLEPDLVSVICGGNDVLLTVRPDVVGYAARLAAMFDRIRSVLPRTLIFTATAPEDWRFLELGPRTRRRVVAGIRELNEATREVAREHRVPYLEVVGHSGLEDPDNFAADGLHPSARGHARAARAFERLLLPHLDCSRDKEGDND